MSYISNRHRNISIWEDNPEILTDPEKYFGPNYKTVINFYELYDAVKISFPYGYYTAYCENPDYSDRLKSAALEIIPEYIANGLHHYRVAYELIAMHLLFDRCETLKYLPLLSYK